MSKLEPHIKDAVDELVKCINSSDVYMEYKDLKDRIENNPEEYELVKKSQEIRRRLYELPESEMNSDYAEHLYSEYEDLCDNTVVYKYAHAEIQMGKILKEILSEIVDTVGLE